MRHRLKGSKLGRTASHKKATMRSLSIALLTHHRIVTTLPKAKELRRYVEPVINRAKEDTMHNRREVFSFIHDNKTVSKLFDEIGPKVGDREGGYTRVVKIGYRLGDAADMAVIELVDYNESAGDTTTSKKKKRTRRAGKNTVKAAETKVAQSANPEVLSSEPLNDTENVIDDEELTSEVQLEESGPDEVKI
jgi:large subunit ribosomal protein L17